MQLQRFYILNLHPRLHTRDCLTSYVARQFILRQHRGEVRLQRQIQAYGTPFRAVIEKRCNQVVTGAVEFDDTQLIRVEAPLQGINNTLL